MCSVGSLSLNSMSALLRFYGFIGPWLHEVATLNGIIGLSEVRVTSGANLGRPLF